MPKRRPVKMKTRRKALTIQTMPSGEVPAPREGEFMTLREASRTHTSLARRVKYDLVACAGFDDFVIEYINPARANVHYVPSSQVYEYLNEGRGWRINEPDYI